MDQEVPSDEDLMDLANKIPPENMSQIAIIYLNLTKLEVSFCKSNSCEDDNPALMFHFLCLDKWRNKRGFNGTKNILYNCLAQASLDGLIDRTNLDFLINRVRKTFKEKKVPPPRVKTQEVYRPCHILLLACPV